MPSVRAVQLHDGAALDFLRTLYKGLRQVFVKERLPMEGDSRDAIRLGDVVDDVRCGAGRRAHFIGIAGVGMSGVAKLLLECGWTVSGSDAVNAPPVSDILAALGIQCAMPYREQNIPTDVDLVIIGKHEALRPETNPEVRFAFTSGMCIASYADVLESLTRSTTNLVVAGSYGKSTMTSLLAWLLVGAGHNPSFLIGGVPRNDIPPARRGEGRLFALEGDEYPSANWDSTPKFLRYNPTHVILTSCEHDHVNVYPTQADYLRPFELLCESIGKSGLVLTCPDNPGTIAAATRTQGRLVTYSLTGSADYRAVRVVHDTRIEFDFQRRGSTVCRLQSHLFGAHNVQNILGVASMVLELGLAEPDVIADLVRTFQGVERRLDVVTDRGVTVYHDMASSRGKARAAIAAIRHRHAGRRLVLVFEPYSLSFRHESALGWYKDAFADADLVALVAPPAIGTTSMSLPLKAVRQVVEDGGVPAVEISGDVAQSLARMLRPTDVVVLMTSGPARRLAAGFTNLARSAAVEETLSAATVL